jgi:hypothetical protein
MALAVVQVAHTNGTSLSSGSAVFGSAPTQGNALIAFVASATIEFSGDHCQTLAGWYGLCNNANSPGQVAFVKLAGASESTTQNPCTIFNTSTMMVTIWEVSGAPNDIVSLISSVFAGTNNAAAGTTTTVTPTINAPQFDNLSLCAACGTSLSATAVSSGPSGFTQDGNDPGGATNLPSWYGHEAGIANNASLAATVTWVSSITSMMTLGTISMAPREYLLAQPISVIQSARTNTALGPSANVNVTESSTPLNGNVLVAVCIQASANLLTVNTSAGWVSVLTGNSSASTIGFAIKTVNGDTTSLTPFITNSSTPASTNIACAVYELSCPAGFDAAITSGNVTNYMRPYSGNATSGQNGTLTHLTGTQCGSLAIDPPFPNGIAGGMTIVLGVALTSSGDTMTSAPANYTQDFYDTSTFPFWCGHLIGTTFRQVGTWTGNWATVASINQQWAGCVVTGDLINQLIPIQPQLLRAPILAH